MFHKLGLELALLKNCDENISSWNRTHKSSVDIFDIEEKQLISSENFIDPGSISCPITRRSMTTGGTKYGADNLCTQLLKLSSGKGVTIIGSFISQGTLPLPQLLLQ